MATITYELWLVQYDAIHFITFWLTDIQSWGSGCDCHEALMTVGKGRSSLFLEKGPSGNAEITGWEGHYE